MPNPILSPTTFLAYSLGCRTNQAEIESICSQLIAYGFREYNPSTLPLSRSPALLLLNTCVVTQKAEKETRQKIRELRKKYPKSLLVVMGCAVTAKEKFNINLPKADLFVLNKNKAETVKTILNSFPDILTNTHDRDKLSITYRNKYHNSGRKFIKIQDGCDKFCSFCLTCHLRGKPTSVPPEKIIEEINFWVNKGIKEIILTGINIGLYENISLLLEEILKQTKIERVSFSSIDPEMLLLLNRSDLSTGQTCLSSNNPRVSQYFHLSLQSGSQTVLERMNRKTDLKELLKKITWIKQNNPFFTFRADIITGFPNETAEEFQETLDFIKKARMSFVHLFHFSARPGTKAGKMIKSGGWYEVSSVIKKQRAEILNKVVEKTRREEAEKMIGTTMKCLIVRQLICHSEPQQQLDEESRWDPSLPLRMTIYEGITGNGWPIQTSIKNPSFAKATAGKQVLSIKGEILSVKITGFEKDYLVGEINSFPTNGCKTSGISTLPSAF